MSDVLARELRFYFIRDCIYVVGGSFIIASWAVAILGPVSIEVLEKIPFLLWFPAAGLAYVVGVVAQQSLLYLGFLETSAYYGKKRPPRLMETIYGRRTRSPWEQPDMSEDQYAATQGRMYKGGSEWAVSALNRRETLKHVGNISAASMALSLPALVILAIRVGDPWLWVVVALAAIFMLLAWMTGCYQGMAQGRTVHREFVRSQQKVGGNG